MPQRSKLPRLNALFDIKHVRDDLKGAELTDPEVYHLAVQQKRLLVTYNVKHFRALATQSTVTGVIGVSQNLLFHQIDTKLTALLVRSSEKALLGKLTTITGETSFSPLL